MNERSILQLKISWTTISVLCEGDGYLESVWPDLVCHRKGMDTTTEQSVLLAEVNSSSIAICILSSMQQD